jgi:HAD superfamily hydrolase (TIGR01450 family)
VNLGDAAAFVFDVDGTLVLSEDPNAGTGVSAIAGGAEVLAALRARGVPYVCFTNGTGQVPADVAAKLRGVGLDVRDAEMLTPASVAAEYLRRTYPDGAVLAFGNDGLREPLRTAGVATCGLDDAERACAVLIGADPLFSYEKLEAACRAVWAGAPMLVTSMAPYFASRRGRMPSTSGAIAAGITHVTGAQPVAMGKPSPLVMDVIGTVLGVPKSQLAVVGDDVRLEIRMAREAGAYSVLVMTGSTRSAEPGDADLVLASVADLRSHL